MKILQIVVNYVTYNLWKFQIDSIKIEAWVTHENVEFLLNKEIRAGLRFIDITLKCLQIIGDGDTIDYNV